MKHVWLPGLIALTLVLAGCGGGSKHDAGVGAGAGTVTVGAYGNFPAQTITGTASAAACTKDGAAFARDSVIFLRHTGPAAAYPADLYYSILREDFADFTAHRCDPRYIGAGLRARLSATQISSLAAHLPSTMAQVIRAGVAITRP